MTAHNTRLFFAFNDADYRASCSCGWVARFSRIGEADAAVTEHGEEASRDVW